MGFSRQEYWSGLPFPSPGDLPDPGVAPRSPTLQADSIIWATRECPDTYCFCCFSFPCEVLHFSYWRVFSLDVGLWWTPVLWALEPLAVLLSNFMFSDENCEDIPHNDTHRGMNSDWKVFTVISKLFLCLLFSSLILICVSMTFSEFVLLGAHLVAWICNSVFWQIGTC